MLTPSIFGENLFDEFFDDFFDFPVFDDREMKKAQKKLGVNIIIAPFSKQFFETGDVQEES